MADTIRPAISIRLYDENNEYVEYKRMFVPWKLLKLAIKLAKELGGRGVAEMDESTVDNLADLVVEVFGGQFSAADLNEKADVGEMIAVIQAIVAKANGGANPTIPSQARTAG